MPVVVVQDGNATEGVTGMQMQRFSYTKRIRVFDATSVEDGAVACFAQGTHWIEGTYSGLMIAGGTSPPATAGGLRSGALTINPGAGAYTTAFLVLHTSVMINGNFMPGGPAVIQAQFRGTDAST